MFCYLVTSQFIFTFHPPPLFARSILLQAIPSKGSKLDYIGPGKDCYRLSIAQDLEAKNIENYRSA